MKGGSTVPDLPDLFWSVIGCLLTVRGRSLSRARIAERLWPDKEHEAARHCLASALWRIRMRLDPDTTPLVTDGNLVALSRKVSIWVDALAFEHRARPLVERPSLLSERRNRARLARVLHAHCGEFLGHIDQEDIAIERARLRALYLDALYELSRAQADAEEWAGAIRSARVLCAAEPLREDAQRLLIEAYSRRGNRGLALRQFQICEATLARELQVPPMPETLALRARLLDARGEAPLTPATAIPPDGHRDTLIHARDSLVDALWAIERTLGTI
ncbi:bacterial transcriptional activator domain-containing protein [Tropicimonas sp. IMCC34043]|uniref:AfsR/SARP family transcriptional regulator n=1 Tax=Tropicimonas sp. IMCC34043 TaxID=2248760 RepID=UPI0013001D9B|nr:bacterial transcriptional activator domain-containing protein [Tropicimonas sp. IMCC34043]